MLQISMEDLLSLGTLLREERSLALHGWRPVKWAQRLQHTKQLIWLRVPSMCFEFMQSIKLDEAKKLQNWPMLVEQRCHLVSYLLSLIESIYVVAELKLEWLGLINRYSDLEFSIFLKALSFINRMNWLDLTVADETQDEKYIKPVMCEVLKEMSFNFFLWLCLTLLPCKVDI